MIDRQLRDGHRMLSPVPNKRRRSQRSSTGKIAKSKPQRADGTHVSGKRSSMYGRFSRPSDGSINAMGVADHVLESVSGHLLRRMLEHYSHIRLDAKRQALDALDAARRNAARHENGDGDSSKGKEEAPDEGGIDALVEVPDDLTSQSRHSLRLSGSPPSGKLMIPLERRDVRVVEGARLEIGSARAC